MLPSENDAGTAREVDEPMVFIEFLFVLAGLAVISVLEFVLVDSYVHNGALSWVLVIGGLAGIGWIIRRVEKDKGRKQQQLRDAMAQTQRLRAEAELEELATNAPPVHVPHPSSSLITISSPQPDEIAAPLALLHPDEGALLDATIAAADDVEALHPWLNHPDLGQVAKVLFGAALVTQGRAAEAQGYFEQVLAEPPSATAEAFFNRYPLPMPFEAVGIQTVVPLSRTAAAIYAAMIHQTRGDSERAMEAIEQADDSDLVTALKSTYAFNLDHYDDVLRVTRWVPRPADTPLEAFALILRGSALREKGRPADALKVLAEATGAAAEVPEAANRLTFEIGRTLAAQGDVAEARRKYIQVHRADPHFPELEEALAALPPE